MRARANGAVLKRGKNFTAEVILPVSITPRIFRSAAAHLSSDLNGFLRSVGIALAVESCSNGVCPQPQSQLGDVLYAGPWNPVTAKPGYGYYQDFTVQISEYMPKGPAIFTLTHLCLLGVGWTSALSRIQERFGQDRLMESANAQQSWTCISLIGDGVRLEVMDFISFKLEYFNASKANVPHTPSVSPVPPVHQDHATGMDIERCKSIIALICKGTEASSLQGLDLKQIEFNDVSPREQEYIMNELDNFDQLAIRFTSFPDLNKITLTIPSFVHQAPINSIVSTLNQHICSIPHDATVVQVHIGTNTELQGESICSTPDITVTIETPDLNRATETLWVVECGFTQTRQQMMKKCERYITDHPTLCVLTMINLVEYPSLHTSLFYLLRHGPLTIGGNDLEFEMWITKPGEKIDLHNHDTMVYAVGSLHPKIDTGALDDILMKALGILRDWMVVAMDAVIKDEHQCDDGDDKVVDSHSQYRSNALAWSLLLEPLLWPVLSKAIAWDNDSPAPTKKLRRS
ncbi:hypothetical protein PAXINDRAFT_100770 [Paxillus involutus ATCC 200175]|uniref:Uncharacterized protein n=1 Tax=Paxillus involutus ATCC 200175 TaxID=664439 RepID=A0A0C9U1H7_PAXIN|nr:hypothetical protein PAXINDRAFT_100770 [Paxillus involutus ATCC 200175]